jgi:hypothetical protein
MKFIRRPDLAPQTRIEIVMTAWLYQGVYGKITHIAQVYHISRTFLYQLLLAATLQLEVLFSDDKCQGQHESPHITPLVLLLRLEGRCSLPSIASILKRLDYQPNSVGYLSAFFGHPLKAGQLTYDCRYSIMHGMPVTGGRGFRGLKPLWYNGVPP